MLPWFFREPERLTREREGIDALSRSAPWLVGYEWLIGAGGLALEAVIRAHEHDYEIRVVFPQLYPEAPAVVYPRNATERLSSHQYGGAEGPLCLQWGPDNWHRDVTAVDLLESTYLLFDTENPLGEDRPDAPIVAPSRHSLTPGQEIRNARTRWYFSQDLDNFLRAQKRLSSGRFSFSLRTFGSNWIVLVHEAAPVDGENWTDPNIPFFLPDAKANDRYAGVWFRTDLDLSAIGAPANLESFRELLERFDSRRVLATDGNSPIEGLERNIIGVLLIDRSDIPHLFVVLSQETVIPCSLVRSGPPMTDRRAPWFPDIRDKSIGIVGLGSAGSKIALCLARMGGRNFYLVDHDLLLPENLRRHALDWQTVALHKVDAVTTVLGYIEPAVKVEVSRIHLTGQESNAAVNGVLERLGSCDIVIDATANPRVFNLLAAISRIAFKPLVWFEVFGGGVGGLIARSRPGLDAAPQDMRSAYLQFCYDNPAPDWMRRAEDYSTLPPDGETLTASDAEVSILAHHAARFVADCFRSKEESEFPHSMYLVGLTKAWIFSGPFYTVPLVPRVSPHEQTPATNAAPLDQANVEFLTGLIEKANA